MSLFRKIRRIEKMSGDEIFVRCREVARRWQDRYAYVSGYQSRPIEIDSVLRHCVDFVRGTGPRELASLAENHSHLHASIKDRCVRDAESVLSGRIELLGKTIELTGIDWHKDPLSEYRWKERFFADVPIYELPADVKYVWEVSRHQYLPTLARGWLFSGDDRNAQRMMDLMSSWVDQNPLYLGVNWTSALEVALRAISWIWSMAPTRTWGGWRGEEAKRIVASMADHAHYLHHHLSYYSSPYNHLVGEASALYMLSFVLQGDSRAVRWRRLALEVLRTHGPTQFYQDGFTVEQASGYHFFTLGFLFQAVQVSRQFGDDLNVLESALNRAAQAAVLLRRPDGTWPCIGDLDSARSIPIQYESIWSFDGLCALGGALFRIDAMGARFGGSPDEAYWLMGANAVDWLRNRHDPLVQPVRGMLEEAGYAAWSNEQGDWVTLDCGPVGAGVHQDDTPSVAHGHDDALSVHLMLGGQEVLRDSGMLRYAGSRDYVDYLRGESAHNRVIIDGVSGMKNAGRLAWANVLQETEIAAGWSSEVVFMRGTLTLDRDIQIERNLMFHHAAGLWVFDLVKLDEPRDIRWHWHVAPWVLDQHDGMQIAPDRQMEFNFWCSASATHESIRDCDEDPAACFAPGYGVREPGGLIQIKTAAASNRVLMMTHFGRRPAMVRVAFGGKGDEFPGGLRSHSWEQDVETTRLTWNLLEPEAECYRVTPADSVGHKLAISECPAS